jgi:glycine oxidase
MDDCVIIGGGMIGLSLAAELQRHGRRVRVLDRRTTHPIASWAAAGILPPPITRPTYEPLEQIRNLSHRLYEPWCRDLSAASGINVSYRRCGGVYLGRLRGERVSLQAALMDWETDGVHIEAWTPDQLRRAEPALAPLPPSTAIYHMPDEVLVRPPRILKALRELLRRSRVPVHDRADIFGWDLLHADRVRLQTSIGTLEARHYCVAAGPWTPELLAPLGLDLPVEPRRGQIVRWYHEPALLKRVINEGPRYLVCREDGHLLVGSTVEDVGFEGTTTDEGVQELVRFARDLVPALREVEPAEHWAGLRPATPDGKPYLGRVPGWPNISIATGHFRSGVHLAPATARLMRQLICDEPIDLDLTSFSPTR